MRIAVVGSGISGLVAAHVLSREHQVVVFEADNYIGGHTNTIAVDVDGTTQHVDTGFIVYNNHAYPNFARLLADLGVESQPSRMSFSVSCERTGLEYNGTSLNRLFSQRRNLVSFSFLRMVKDIVRFYRESPRILKGASYALTLGTFLRERGYSDEFVHQHLLPMGAAIWSASTENVLDFSARFFVEFFENHGFLKVSGGPQWRVVKGGSQRYIAPLTRRFAEQIRTLCPVSRVTRHPEHVALQPAQGESERFDYAVIATHSDQALAMLSDADEREREILGAIPYTANETVLHTDTSLLPRKRRAWASWNYHLGKDKLTGPTVTYYMNMLQSLRSPVHYCVTLNRTERIAPGKIIRKFVYHHPAYSATMLRAQRRIPEISGQRRTFFCGAYCGFGFHEDGVRSALAVCRHFNLGL